MEFVGSFEYILLKAALESRPIGGGLTSFIHSHRRLVVHHRHHILSKMDTSLQNVVQRFDEDSR